MEDLFSFASGKKPSEGERPREAKREVKSDDGSRGRSPSSEVSSNVSPATEAPQRKVFSVTELTRQIKGTLTQKFPNLWVEGEVSNLRVQSSGHCYFTLKDAGAQISVVLFRREAASLKFQLADGLQVTAHGDIDVYEPRGNYQLIARLLQPKGVGQLQAQFEALKQRLAAEGLFEPSRKKAIPPFPERIGIITSPTGAAIRDILHVINRRFPNVHVIINPVRVQGIGAAEEIAAAVDELNAMNARNALTLDVLILARGGGSLEDLWAFNEEIVARAVARSTIPTISAIGHEVDFTICDFVADLRAPTPSAAAELVVAQRAELVERVRELRLRVTRSAVQQFESYKHRVDMAAGSYVFREPENIIRNYQQRVDVLLENANAALRAALDNAGNRLRHAETKLELLNPRATLERGYSITQRADGRVVTSSKQVKRGETLKTLVRDGEIESEVK